MNKTIILFFLLSGWIFQTLAQETNYVSLDSVVKDITFSKIKVEDLVYSNGEIFVDLNLTRRGAMQQVNGPVMTGGKEWTSLPARYMVRMDQNMKIVQDEFFFFKPSGTGRVNYLAKPIENGQVKILAKHDEVSTAQGGAQRVRNFMPDAPAEPESATQSKTEIVQVPHMQPSLPITPKGIKKLKVRHMVPSEYGFKKTDVKEMDLDNSILGLNEDESFALTAGFLIAEDKITGNSFGLFGIKVKKDKTDIQLHRQLLFTVGPDGKAKTYDLRSEKPMVGIEALPIYEEVPQDPKPLDMVLFMHKEVKKKSNPNPNKNVRRLVVVNEDGTLLQNVTFETLASQMRWAKTSQLPGGKFLMVGTGSKPAGLNYYVFDKSGLVKSDLIGESHPMYKRMQFNPRNTFHFDEGYQKNLSDGGVLFFDRMKHTETARPGQVGFTYHDYGRFYMKFDKDGNMTDAIRIPRPKGVSSTKAPNEVTLISNDKKEVYYERVIVKKATESGERNTYKGQLVSIDLETLETKITPMEAGDFTIFSNPVVDKERQQVYAIFQSPSRKGEIRVARFDY